MGVKRFIEEEKKIDVKNDCFEIIKMILLTFHDEIKSLTGSLGLYDSKFDEPIIFCLLRAVEECHLHGEDFYKDQIEQLLEIISILSKDHNQLSEKNHNGDYPIHYFASLGSVYKHTNVNQNKAPSRLPSDKDIHARFAIMAFFEATLSRYEIPILSALARNHHYSTAE